MFIMDQSGLLVGCRLAAPAKVMGYICTYAACGAHAGINVPARMRKRKENADHRVISVTLVTKHWLDAKSMG
jgi:hypothetical protein